MSNLKEMQTVAVCRFVGPMVLFICVPSLTFVYIALILKETKSGNLPTTRNVIEMIIIYLMILIFGIWTCKRGYGWFEWLSFSKKNK